MYNIIYDIPMYNIYFIDIIHSTTGITLPIPIYNNNISQRTYILLYYIRAYREVGPSIYIIIYTHTT